jgi:hypothetical protein
MWCGECGGSGEEINLLHSYRLTILTMPGRRGNQPCLRREGQFHQEPRGAPPDDSKLTEVLTVVNI